MLTILLGKTGGTCVFWRNWITRSGQMDQGFWSTGSLILAIWIKDSGVLDHRFWTSGSSLNSHLALWTTLSIL